MPYSPNTTAQKPLALELLKPTSQFYEALRDLVLIFCGSMLVSLLAQLAIPLPFTVVPITGQTLGVLLVGATLGSKRGAISMSLYLLEGMAGLPVFAGGTGGPGVLVGPTGGYLVGFVASAFITGLLAERGLDRNWKTSLPAFIAGQAVIFAIGLPWLAQYVGASQVWVAGFWPFLPGALIKSILAGMILPTAWKWVGRR